MKTKLAILFFAVSLVVGNLHAEVNKQLGADVNTVASVVEKSERDNVVWFLIHGDSAITGGKRIAMMTAKNEINRISRKGDAHDSLVRLFGRLMTRKEAALDSRKFAYSRLRSFSANDKTAKKVLDEATKTVKERKEDPPYSDAKMKTKILANKSLYPTVNR